VLRGGVQSLRRVHGGCLSGNGNGGLVGFRPYCFADIGVDDSSRPGSRSIEPLQSTIFNHQLPRLQDVLLV